MNKEQTRWACRRGMLELDILLGPFFEAAYDTFDSEQIQTFETLLDQQDPDLFQWFIGSVKPEDSNMQRMIKRIKDFNASTHAA